MCFSENKWNTWSPKALKSKKSQALVYKDTEKCDKIGVTTKIDELTTARKALVELQMEIARKEHQFMTDEHDLKMLHLVNDEKRKQEIHELLIKKMDLQNKS